MNRNGDMAFVAGARTSMDFDSGSTFHLSTGGVLTDLGFADADVQINDADDVLINGLDLHITSPGVPLIPIQLENDPAPDDPTLFSVDTPAALLRSHGHVPAGRGALHAGRAHLRGGRRWRRLPRAPRQRPIQPGDTVAEGVIVATDSRAAISTTHFATRATLDGLAATQGIYVTAPSKVPSLARGGAIALGVAVGAAGGLRVRRARA